MNEQVILEEFECQFVSCMVMDNTLISRRRLQPRHLSNKKTKELFEGIVNLDKMDKEVNIVTLFNETSLTMTEVTTITSSAPSTQIFESLEESIFKRYQTRYTKKILEKAMKKLEEEKDIFAVKSVIEKLEDYENFEQEEAYDINEVFEENYKQIKEAYLNGGKPRGILTGINLLDHYTNGVEKGNVNIFAARPGVGKTTLALTCANNMSKDAKVLFASLEMTRSQLGYRLMSQISKIQARNIANGKLKEETLVKIFECSGKIKQGQLFIMDNAQTIESLERNIAYYVMKHKVEVVIIDYLSLIENTGFYKDENARLTHIINRISNIAKKMNIGIICLAQLNREAERSVGDPKMSHLKDCGAIEQYASVIIALGEDQEEKEERRKYNIKDHVHTLYLYILKNRHGEMPASPIVLNYNKAIQSVTQR